VGLVGDAKATLAALIAVLGASPRPAAAVEAQGRVVAERKAAWREELKLTQDDNKPRSTRRAC
jgi:thiamine pyrophosphate-dependent acetolactate synthase large subunit-like protein